MKFVFQADAVIEADSIEDAIEQVSLHFAHLNAEQPSQMIYQGDIVIAHAKNGEDRRCLQ